MKTGKEGMYTASLYTERVGSTLTVIPAEPRMRIHCICFPKNNDVYYESRDSR